jgi:hypothetical protein
MYKNALNALKSALFLIFRFVVYCYFFLRPTLSIPLQPYFYTLYI